MTAKTNVTVKLVGENGNVFHLAGLVKKALKKNGYGVLAEEFIGKIFKCGSYDEALVLMQEYVEVE